MPTLVRAGTVQMTRQRQITIYAQAPGEREGAVSQVGFSGVSQKQLMVYCMVGFSERGSEHIGFGGLFRRLGPSLLPRSALAFHPLPTHVACFLCSHGRRWTPSPGRCLSWRGQPSWYRCHVGNTHVFFVVLSMVRLGVVWECIVH